MQFACIFVDVTDRKRAEDALRESEARHRELNENLPQRIFHKDADLVYISCNKHYADDLGIRPEEVSGKTDFDFFPHELANKYREDDRRVLELDGPDEIEESWRIVEPILENWAERSSIEQYPAGSWGVPGMEQLMKGCVSGWHKPT